MTNRSTGTTGHRSMLRGTLAAVAALFPLCLCGLAQTQAADTDRFGDPLPAGALVRAGTVRSPSDLPDGFELPSSVRGLVFSPDNKLLATRGAPSDPSAQRLIRIWDAQTGKLMRMVTAHEEPVTDLAFSPDGRLIIAAAAEHPQGTQIWEIASGRLLQSLPGGRGQFALSEDGQRLSIAARFRNNDVIRTFDLASGNEIRRAVLDVSHRFTFSPDGGKILSQKSDRTNVLRLLDTGSGKPLARLTGGEAEPGTLAFSAESRTVAVALSSLGVRDETQHLIVLWELASERPVFELTGHTRRVLALSFSPDGRYLVSGGADSTVRVWEVASGKEVHVFRGHRLPVATVAVSPDGTRIASGSFDRTALIWDFGSVKRSFLPETPLSAEAFERIWAELAAVSPSNAYRAIGTLRANSESAAMYLKQRIDSIVRPVQEERIRQLIADLEHQDYVVRFRATEELQKLREVAKPILLKVIQQTTSAEVRYRVRRILTGAEDTPRFSPSDVRRIHRVIHALEYLPGEASEATLRVIIEDFPSDEVVREARLTLERLRRAKS